MYACESLITGVAIYVKVLRAAETVKIFQGTEKEGK